MIRVSPVTDHQAGPGVRIGFWFTRRALARLTGRTPAGALDYATAMTQTPADVPDVLVNTLREHLGEDQLLELTHVIALENLRGRFNLALGIEPAGFSTSTVCATAIAATPDEATP